LSLQNLSEFEIIFYLGEFLREGKINT